ncbi:MAG: efflux RND transporter permease subunit [Saprospiraceae bacterium]|nr:efflux RND transporter permease subunit [Saprospiraceae bacterium]
MIQFSFRNPYLVVVLAIVVVLLSAVTLPRIPVDILPQFKKSAMQILTLYPGMPAEVVEKDITSRMERWTGQSPGIEKQLSKSIMGVSIVTNFYGEDIDPAEAMANASSYAMSDMYYQPPGTLPPMIQPFDPTASRPLMLLTVRSSEKTGSELYDVAYYSLRQMLSGVKGVIAPAAYGGAIRRIYVYVDPVRLEALGISQTQVQDAIQRNTTMIPSGIAQLGKVNYGISAKGMIRDIREFDDIEITRRNGKPVYIKDIGHTADAQAIQTNIARVDGSEQVYLPIYKRPGSNTIQAVNAVRNALPALRQRLPPDVELQVIFDQSSYVRNSIAGLRNAIAGGFALVLLVLFAFLGNFRSSLAVAISLPLSLLFAVVVWYVLGQSANAITLGGIVLVLGLLVDNSIVVVENIDRYMRLGRDSFSAAREGVQEIALPILASTLIIIVIFFPVFFLTGITRFLFSPLAITVGGAMIGSYLFSVTIIPVACAYLFRNRVSVQNPTADFTATAPQRPSLLDRIRDQYAKSLGWVLRRRAMTLCAVLLCFIVSLYGMLHLGYELFPRSDVGQMEIQVRTESGTPLRETERMVAQMESLIRRETGSDLGQIISNIGVFYDLPAVYTPNSGTQDAFIGVQLAEDHRISTFEYAERLRPLMQREFPGVELSFNTGGMLTAALNEGKPAPIDVQIIGNDLRTLREIAVRIRDTLSSISAARDVRILQRIDQPAKEIDIDRVRAAALGVDPVNAIKNLVAALNSTATYEKAFWIDERNGNHYYVGVTYPEQRINHENTLDNVAVGTSNSLGTTPFRNFSKIEDALSPVEINHQNLMRVFNVFADVEGDDLGSVSDEARRRIASMALPKGYSVSFQGEVATIRDSFGGLGLGLALSVAFAALIILPLFRSFRKTAIALATFPLGLIGVALAMFIGNAVWSIQTIMGVIMMVGIAASYGNLLIDRINSLLREGLAGNEAILSGARDRFRPVLMTSLTTIFGLLPSVLIRTYGSEATVPLATVVIGGTAMAALLTLYVIPLLYSITFKFNQHD